MNKLIEIGKKHNIDIEIFKEKHNSTDISTLNDKIKLFQITNVSKYIISTTGRREYGILCKPETHFNVLIL